MLKHMPEGELIPCNLCDRYAFNILYRKQLEGLTYQIVKCKGCGLVYMNPHFAKEENRELYNEDYYYFDTKDDLLNLHKAEEQFRRIKRYSSGGKLLEIGCAKGFFLKIASSHGWESYGVDISAHACMFAQKQLNLNVIPQALEDADLPERSFDLIALWDTIEHFRDPFKALTKIKSLLKDDGMVVIETPNINSIFFALFRRHWLGFNPFHLYYFSPYTLKGLLSKAGFSRVNSETTVVGLFSWQGIWQRGLKTPLAQLLSALGLKDSIKAAVANVTPKHTEIDLEKWNARNTQPQKNILLDLINYPTDYIFTKLMMGDHLVTIAQK